MTSANTATDRRAAAPAAADDARCEASAPARRGRPLSPELSDHILGQVWQQLQEVGYDGLRMSDVAEQAGVGLGTIYRRWPTKRDLVYAALCSASLPFELPRTDHPRDDIRRVLASLADTLNAGHDQSAVGLLECLREAPEIAEAWRWATVMQLHDYLHERLAVVLGSDDPNLDLRAQTGPALLFYQAKFCGKHLDAERLATQLTELLCAPIGFDAQPPGTMPDGADASRA